MPRVSCGNEHARHSSTTQEQEILSTNSTSLHSPFPAPAPAPGRADLDSVQPAGRQRVRHGALSILLCPCSPFLSLVSFLLPLLSCLLLLLPLPLFSPATTLLPLLLPPSSVLSPSLPPVCAPSALLGLPGLLLQLLQSSRRSSEFHFSWSGFDGEGVRPGCWEAGLASACP